MQVKLSSKQTTSSFFDTWYLDDGQLFCHARDVDIILRTLDKHLNSIGASRATGDDIKSTVRFYGCDRGESVVTNYTKSTCKVYFDGDGTASHVLGIDADVTRGEHSAFDDQFQSVVEKVIHLQERIGDLEDGPCEFTLVKNCASICKVMHLLRAVGPYISPDKFALFDTSVIGSLGRIIGEPIKDSARVQANLPTRQSGLGLMTAAIMSQVAFIAARIESGAFVRHLCDGISSIFQFGGRLEARFDTEVKSVIDDFLFQLRRESKVAARDQLVWLLKILQIVLKHF